ncbi:hypothetical protein KKB18_12725 [bacterium]|nr:hypothetical protein [bacterium]
MNWRHGKERWGKGIAPEISFALKAKAHIHTAHHIAFARSTLTCTKEFSSNTTTSFNSDPADPLLCICSSSKGAVKPPLFLRISSEPPIYSD